MKIHDIPTTPIRRIEGARSEDVARMISRSREPMIFSGLDKEFAFLRKWNLDFFGQFSEPVPAQRPESDGVNYFVKYNRIPMSEFVKKIRAGESLYIGARQIMGQGGSRSDNDGLGHLSTEIELPSFIRKELIYSSNLWIGAGNNRTLLHYDPWDGLMMVAAGRKDFIMIPDTETSKVAQYGAFGFRSLHKGAVLHSKIRPLSVQPEFQEKLGQVKGALRGSLQAGEAIFIPVGFWHYVESSDLNIGLNFFIHFEDKKLNFREPMRTYWIKDNVTLWPVRWYQATRMAAGNFYHQFIPRKPKTES